MKIFLCCKYFTYSQFSYNFNVPWFSRTKSTLTNIMIIGFLHKLICRIKR